MYHTYILKCADNSYYVGSTDSLDDRLKDHNQGKGAEFTAKRRPCVIIWHKSYETKTEALKKEIEIKHFSRLKKEKLIFNKNSVWQHYKGTRYIIISIFDDMIVYSALEEWNKYLTRKNIPGEQLQVWLRHKDQWLDWIDKEKGKLRFLAE